MTSTLVFLTGPDFDHTTQSSNGYYQFIEASNKQEGDKARLISQRHTAISQKCITFW